MHPQQDQEVFRKVEKLFWERERMLLNQSLAFIGAKVGPRFVFQGGYRLVPRAVFGPYALSVSLEPLGVWVSHKRLFDSDTCFEPVEGKRLCFGNYGRFDRDFIAFGSVSITRSFWEETEFPKEFLSFYNHYTHGGRLVYRFGNPEVFVNKFVSLSGDEGFVAFMKGPTPIPWLLWVDGELFSLLPRPMSDLG